MQDQKKYQDCWNYRYKWKIFNRIFSSPTFIFQGFQCTLLTNTPEVSNLKNTQFTPLTTQIIFYFIIFKKIYRFKRKYFLMEVSSHGIDQSRISGLDFFAKSLTSFSKDHLDYHKNFSSYRNAKKAFSQHPMKTTSYPLIMI